MAKVARDAGVVPAGLGEPSGAVRIPLLLLHSGHYAALVTDVPQMERVLIVEDNVALLRALGRHVSSWGVDAVEACTYADAVTGLAEPPDLIICDIRLPDGSGIQFLEEAAQVHPKPLMVVISGEAALSGLPVQETGFAGDI